MLFGKLLELELPPSLSWAAFALFPSKRCFILANHYMCAYACLGVFSSTRKQARHTEECIWQSTRHFHVARTLDVCQVGGLQGSDLNHHASYSFGRGHPCKIDDVGENLNSANCTTDSWFKCRSKQRTCRCDCQDTSRFCVAEGILTCLLQR